MRPTIYDRLLDFVTKSNYLFQTPEMQAEIRSRVKRLHKLISILSPAEMEDNEEVRLLLDEIESIRKTGELPK